MIKRKLITCVALASMLSLVTPALATKSDVVENNVDEVSSVSIEEDVEVANVSMTPMSVDEKSSETTTAPVEQSSSNDQKEDTVESTSENLIQEEENKDIQESSDNEINKSEENKDTEIEKLNNENNEENTPSKEEINNENVQESTEENTEEENTSEQILEDDSTQVENAENIAQQQTTHQNSNYNNTINNLEHVEEIELDWRMHKIDRVVSLAKEDLSILEEMKDDSRVVGTIEELGQVWELSEDEDNDYIYIESGKVRGFVNKDSLYREKEAEEKLKEQQYELYKELEKAYSVDVADMFKDKLMPKLAEPSIPWEENSAIAYRPYTTYSVVSDKILYSKDDDVNVLDGMIEDEIEEDSKDIVGTLKTGDLAYILEIIDSGWYFIESGDVRGFVHQEYLVSEEDALNILNKDKSENDKIEEIEESFAECKVEKPEETKTFWYSLKSTKEGASDIELRKEILEYAQQFVGNAYVWGGNDPHTGADCSGFVKYVYNHFGIALPRVADDQAYVGKKIPLSEAAPGDLIFFSRGGYIYHVAMYAGNGETIEAHSSAVGIVHMKRDMGNVCWATRLL